MELGAEISQKVKKTIKKQLQTLGCYVDDELPEYIMVMIANKRTQEQMVDDLNLFLNDEAEKFVSWLTVVLGRIQKAMELPDIDGLCDDLEPESKKKPKKGKKSIELEDNTKNEKHERKRSEERKRMKETKDRELEEKDKEKKKHERSDRHKEKETKESERKDKERKQRMEERAKKEKEREEEANKRRLEREEEISKRRAAREKRDKEEKERREKHKKKEREIQEKENRERHHHKSKEDQKRNDSKRSEEEGKNEKDTDDIEKEKLNGLEDKGTDADVRKEAEHEAKRIENRPSRNPMEFVKQIAKDITDQLTLSQTAPPSKDDNADDEIDLLITKVDPGTLEKAVSKKNDNADITLRDNVSLQAVSQYEDGENEIEKGDSKSHHKSRKDKHGRRSGSRSRSKSGTHHHSRSDNKSRSSDSRSTDKAHQSHRSRSHSKENHDRRHRRSEDSRNSSRKDDVHSSKSRNENEEESSRKRNHSKSESTDRLDSSKQNEKGETPRRKDSSSHQNRRESNEGLDRSNKDTNNEEEEEEEEEEEDDQDSPKPSISSQVQVFTDFKRKPSLAKHHQASSVLLKRAVTEVVNEKPDGEENEDDVELDYNETNDENDEFSDEPSDDVVLERRVINFDEEKLGLPTITVNFNKENVSNTDGNKHSTRSNDHDRNRTSTRESRHSRSSNHGSSHSRKLSDDKDAEHRKSLIPGIGKNDARYTILRSRLEHEGHSNERKLRHDHKHEKSRNVEKHLSSMVADLEEKSRKTSKRGSWRDKRGGHDTNNKHNDRHTHSHRRRHHMGDHDSSEDEEDKRKRLKILKEEARRIEMQELSRSGQSDEGDLRDLLVGKREGKSSSEDDDAGARRLRERIKEEKHKILFGKLRPEERDRSKKERENLVEQLKSKTKRRRKEDVKDSPEWIEKVPIPSEGQTYHNDGDQTPDQNLYVENVTDSEEEDGKNDLGTSDWMENKDEEEVSGGEMDDIGDNEADGEKGEIRHLCNQDDLEEVSDEELADEFDKDEDTEDRGDVDMKNSEGESTDVLKDNGDEKEPADELEEEEVEEVVEIEVEVSDNENLDDDGNDISLNTSKQAELDMEDDGNDSVEIIEGDKNVSPEVLKNSMHMESSEDSPTRDENLDEIDKDTSTDIRNTDKYDKKSKQKSMRRKRMRHEFIVTLDGLGDGKRLSIKTGGREKSPKIRRLQEKQRCERHRRHRHMSRSQSDEEFEEILRRKEEEEKRSVEQSRISESKKSHRSRSQPSSDKDSKHRELRVNREIMLAENKLKTQKVFKKSLETVQNVTNNLTVNNIANNLEQVCHKTAFINPNFQPKLPVEAMNAAVAIIPAKIAYNDAPIKVLAPPIITPKPIRNLAVTEKLILPPTILTPAPDKVLVAPLRIERSKDFILPSGTLDIVALPHVDMSSLKKNLMKPSVENESANKSNVPDLSKEMSVPTETSTASLTNVETANQPLPSPTSSTIPSTAVSEEAKPASAATPAKASIQERCAFWPECKNQSCPYIHPSINCKLFPNCSYGQHCIYIHPPCMFGDSCSNATCPFMHVRTTPSTFSGFSQICKYYPNCAKADCPFKHVAKPCHYGSACNKPECIFSHDPPSVPLSSSSMKWVAEKAHVSERKFAADEAIVTHIPVSIVSTNG